MNDRSRQQQPRKIDSQSDGADAAWVDQLRDSQLAFESICLSMRSDPELCGQKNRELLRSFWAKQAKLLKHIALMRLDEGASTSLYECGLLNRTAGLLEDLGDGYIPVWVESARNSGGGRSMSRFERNTIAPAVFFLQAVEDKVIQCSRPIAEVSEAYGVTKATVRKWRKSGAKITDDIQPPHKNNMKDAIVHAGTRYRSSGRGGWGKPNY